MLPTGAAGYGGGMFRIEQRQGGLSNALALLELIFHATVRNIRKSHGNAIAGLLINIAQTILMVAVFYAMFEFFSLRRIAIRGDFLLYVMSGIFLYMTHSKTVGEVVRAEGPTSAMMKHAPMNTIVAIAAAALASLYLQLLSAALVLGIYHMAFAPLEVDNWAATLGIFLLSWFGGVAMGVVLLAAKPWAPDAAGLLTAIYQRGNMVASGKMFVANMMPSSMLVLFDWNPLFHCIDQARGALFLNYSPHYTSIAYPVQVALALLMIGLMGEFYTRRHASLSWGAGR